MSRHGSIKKQSLFLTLIVMLDKFNNLVALLSSSPTFIIASSIILATVCLLKVLNPGALALLFILIHLVSMGFGRSCQAIGSKSMEGVSTREESSGFTQYSHVRVFIFYFQVSSVHLVLVTVSSSLTLETYLVCLPVNTFRSLQKLMAKLLPGVTLLSVAMTIVASFP